MAVLWQHDERSINKPFGTFNPPQAYRKSQIQKGLLIDLLLYLILSITSVKIFLVVSRLFKSQIRELTFCPPFVHNESS